MNDERKFPRRAVLRGLVLGLGSVSLGRSLFACASDTAGTSLDRHTTGNGEPAGATDQDEFVPGASKPQVVQAAVQVPNAAWEGRVKQLESEQARLFRPALFSAADEGVMKGKSGSHVPKASIVDEDGEKKVLVVVNHVMGKNLLDSGVPVDAAAADAAHDASGGGKADSGAHDAAADAADAGPVVAPPEHYITTIYLRATIAGVDTVVALWEFSSGDAAPPTVKFSLPAGVTQVTALEWCTLHGLWTALPLAIS